MKGPKPGRDISLDGEETACIKGVDYGEARNEIGLDVQEGGKRADHVLESHGESKSRPETTDDGRARVDGNQRLHLGSCQKRTLVHCCKRLPFMTCMHLI